MPQNVLPMTAARTMTAQRMMIAGVTEDVPVSVEKMAMNPRGMIGATNTKPVNVL